MKIHALILSAVLFVCSLPSPATAQTAAGLSIQTYAGLTITGAVDTIYQVEATTDPSQSEGWSTTGVLKLPVSPHRWFDVTSSTAEKRFYRAMAVTNIEPVTNMVWIQPGTFTMGSPETEVERQTDETQHEVTLTRGFWMGAFEVTQGEYLAVVGSNPSYFRNGTRVYGSGGPVTNELQHPVEKVLWFNATNYCGLLTERERVAGRLPAAYVYRLPTEAEWEYACRAGTRTAFHYGAALISGMANFVGTNEYVSSVGTIANSSGIYLGRTVEVGSYAPNAWGLYNMHGNVWEWCQDRYGAYPAGPVTDPMGPGSGSNRVVRGGYWDNNARICRSADRENHHPLSHGDVFGFRVVLAPGQ